MILSIESSCDDSSIAITRVDDYKLVYHKKISQELDHSVYGGVVPELAARLHTEALPKILEECKEYFPYPVKEKQSLLPKRSKNRGLQRPFPNSVFPDSKPA